MAPRIEPIVVRKSYGDKTYRDFLRHSFRIEYNRDARGREKYFRWVMKPALTGVADTFDRDDKSKWSPNYDRIEGNLKTISDFVGDGYTDRRFNDEFLRLIDAFLQIKLPGFNSAYAAHRNLNAVGMYLSSFLRDEQAYYDRSSLLKNATTLQGVYRYQDVDTHHGHTGDTRTIAFLSGDTIDFLSVMDFVDVADARPERAARDVHSGFCVPGNRFSLTAIRSENLKSRQIGILYTPGRLTDMSGDALDEITYEVFTTEDSHAGSRSTERDESLDPLFAKALDIHYGPRLRRILRKLTDADVEDRQRAIIDSYRIKLVNSENR